MPKYKYRAVDGRGKTVRGEMAAEDETELFIKLKRENRYLISVEEAVKKRHTRPMDARALSDFCRETGALLHAGVSLARALWIQSQNESIKPGERAVYAQLLRIIRQGTVLSDAMESLGGVFPPVLIHTFRAAETAGNLDVTANRMAEHYSKVHRMNLRIKSAMAYPKFLCILTAVVMGVLFRYVLPQFEHLFSLLDELPVPTRILYGITDVVTESWYFAITGITAGAAAAHAIRRIEAVRLWLDKVRLHLPRVGNLWKVIYTARFARSLSALYSAGVPIVTAMQISRHAIGNTYVDKQFDAAVSAVRAGGYLSDALEPIDGFLSKLAFSVRVGEETGMLDVILDSTAEALEGESEIAMNRLVSYLEPGFIIVMALVVGFIMVAVMMPIYESYTAIEASAYF